MAHELNEPLGSILGFTQLIEKTPRMPRAALTDLAKVKAAALHARDIIRKSGKEEGAFGKREITDEAFLFLVFLFLGV